MVAMKVFITVLGILMLVGGMQLAAYPVETSASAVKLLGILLLVSGILSIFSWADRKRNEEADGWSLAGSIITALLGFFVLLSPVLRLELLVVIPYLMGAWMLVNGAIYIAMAIRVCRLRREGLDTRIPWGMQLVLGILMIVLAVLIVVNPWSGLISLGVWIGIEIAFTGVSILLFGIFY